MTMLLAIEAVDSGKIKLSDTIVCSENAKKMGVIFAIGSFISSAVFGPIGIIFAIISFVYVLLIKKKFGDKSVFHLIVTCLAFVAAIVNVVCLFSFVNYQNELSEKRTIVVENKEEEVDFEISITAKILQEKEELLQ